MGKMKNNITKPYVKEFYRGNKLNFIIALSEVILTTAGALLLSWLLQQIIDLISGSNQTFDLLQLLFISLGLLGGMIIAYMISYFYKPKFIIKGISQYKEYIYEEITKKNISAFLGENSSTYISALTNDIQTIEKGYLWDSFDILTSSFTFIGALVLMFWYSPLLTLFAIGISLIPLLASLLTGSKMAKAEEEVSSQNEKYTASIKDSLSGFSVIKSFKVEKEMIKLFKDNVKKLARCQERRQKLAIIIEMLGMSAGVIAQLGVFIFGAYLALSGKGVTAGITIVFVQLMNYVINPINKIPTLLAERKSAKLLINKIAVSLNKNVREEKKSNFNTLNKEIKLENLTFAYDKEKVILDNINYKFELGKKYAIVGTSGSGKSTLLNLLMASRDDYKGNIKYDDEELKDISSENLYEIESIIQQNVFIFNATIKDNITMFQQFSDEEIEKAIKLSGLSTLIAEKGQDYLCGENGSGLSGGEKQRISIARSLLRKTPVLLVDEATAALDKETAFQVSNAILDLNGVTSIVVTHSLEESLLKKYDEIITLKGGKIVEAGSFNNLINQKGYFYSLYTVSQ